MKTLYRGKIFTFNQQASLQNLQGVIPDALFVNDERFTFLRDGAIIVENGKISAVGDYSEISSLLRAEDKTVDYRGKLIAPGFIDTHIHATQASSVSAYGEKLLTWLDNYVFPSEVAFNSEQSGRREYDILTYRNFNVKTATL